MKVVISTGELATRISKRFHLNSNLMIEISEKPNLWYIMKIYKSQGFNEFTICLDYKGYQIPAILKRNIFDIAISLRNHIHNLRQNAPMIFVNNRFSSWMNLRGST